LINNDLYNNWTSAFISFRIQKKRKNKNKKEITHPQTHKDNKNGKKIFTIIFLRLNEKISIHYKFVSLSNSAYYENYPILQGLFMRSVFTDNNTNLCKTNE